MTLSAFTLCFDKQIMARSGAAAVRAQTQVLHAGLLDRLITAPSLQLDEVCCTCGRALALLPLRS